jgi:epoxyqueuosine reductase
MTPTTPPSHDAAGPGQPPRGAVDWAALADRIARWGRDLGFAEVGISDTDLSTEETRLVAWLDAGRHGEMDYMARHGVNRARPAALVPGTLRVISARMDYLPPGARDADAVLADPLAGYVARYALGRDYHKVLRARLQALAQRLAAHVGPLGSRVFTDSAPVLEVELAARAGLGWRGKHTLALQREGGSMFFLGEIFIDRALPPTAPASAHCGSCSACIDICPTRAIVAPYRLDARRCISYLTIEHEGPIPPQFRAAIGNRIYGCDDCQLVCPWNKYAQASSLPDFDVRDPLGSATLLQLWGWDEAEFLRRSEGSAMRRIGYPRWQRNLAVAMGNALRTAPDEAMAQALRERLVGADEMVAEHIAWALQPHAA